MNQTHAGSIERKALIFNIQKYNMLSLIHI